MAKLATGLVGGALGFAVGGPFGARVGFTIGTIAGGYLFPPPGQHVEGPRLSNLETMSANEGAPLPILYGAARLPGVAIWTNGIDETATTEEHGGKGGSPGSSSSTTYTYSASFAVAFCEGAVSGVRRIWADTKLIYNAKDTVSAETLLASGDKYTDLRIYDGSETQERDPLIEAKQGTVNTPAFRGACYIVFEDLQLADFGNRIPSISAEVVKGAVVDPPILITEWDHVPNTHWGEYIGGVLRIPNIEKNVPTPGESTSTITSYNLDGEVIEKQKYTGANIDRWSSATFFAIKNLPEIFFQRKDASGTGFGTGSWWVWQFGGAEGIQIPGSPRPFSPDGFLGGGSLEYYYAVGSPALYWNRNVYAENIGTANEFGIARYPEGPGGVGRIPSTQPDAFFEMDPYLATSNITQLVLSAGDDGYLYVNRAQGGAFTGGVEFIRLDGDLNLVDTFKFPGFVSANAHVAAWNGRMAITFGSTMELYDISDETLSLPANEAVLIGTAGRTGGISQTRKMTGIGNGLFIADDGVWSMREQVTLSAPTLKTVVDDICQRCGLSIGQIDATDLTQIVDGYVINNPMPGRSAIEGLQPAYNFDGFESDGKVKFRNRGGSSDVTIPIDDIGAFTANPPLAEFTTTRQQELELPQEVNFAYQDKNQDYEVGAQRARRIITTSVNKVSLQMPVVMSSTKAAQAAEIYLQNVWAERVRYSYNLSSKYDYLEPADLVTIPTATGDVLTRIVSIAKGASNVLEIDAVTDLSVLYTSVEVGNDSSLEDEQALTYSGATKLSVIDLALLRENDDSPGYYLAAAGHYLGWMGASISSEIDGLPIEPVAAITNKAICGTTTNALPISTYYGTDVTSRLNVALVGDGALSSVTDAQFLAGENVAVVNDEIVYFRDATLESDGTYTLRRFLRGRQATLVEEHEETGRFVALSTSTTYSIEGAIDDTAKDVTFLATSFGSQSTSAVPHTLQNARIKPNPPVHAHASKQPNGDIVGTFGRNARKFTAWVSAIDVPLDETTEEYEVEVIKDGAAVRTISVDDSKTFTYTAADQSTDFGVGQGAVDFIAYQMSDRVGKGKPSKFTSTSGKFFESAYITEVLSDSPIGYWPLGGNTFNWVAPYDAAIVEDTEGELHEYARGEAETNGLGAYRYFGTQTQKFRISQSAGALYNLGDEFSLEFFIRQSLTTVGDENQLFGRGAANNKTGADSCWFCILPLNNRDDLGFSVKPTTGANELLITSGEGLNDDAWHHIVCVFDNPSSGGTNKQYVYVDGVEAANRTLTASAGTAMNPSPDREWEAFTQTTSSRTFIGSLAHIAIYTSALTSTQISDHYTASGL